MAAPPLLRTAAVRARHTARKCPTRGRRRFTHTSEASSSSSRRRSNMTGDPSCHRLAARFPPSAAIALAILGTATYLLAPSSAAPSSLNETTFAPYAITARDAVSGSSVVLTVAPRRQHGAPAPPYLAPQSSRWRHPLWSVEFKQPQVQIARHYTPLPPHDDEDPRDGRLRFYVRAVGGGEMSRYLHGLRVGDEVYLRGPHPGLDVLGRLGARGSVVFLAGGTGIVPGMQVAAAVLERDDAARVELLWAVRRRDEIQRPAAVTPQTPRPWWSFWTAAAGRAAAAAPTEVTADLENPSAVARELMRLKARFGPRLHVRLAVDEERTRFTARDVQGALAAGDEGGPSRAVVADAGCPLHDQLLHAHVSELDGPRAACRCGGGADARLSGKNLLMVSGPDGFVAHYAGEKTWRGGTLTQGPVGGVAGQLQRRDPSLARNWLVLKL
ncbi:hypothetical protein E4U53_003631 [Claviceps sorghi]|nr:hypothetical protein E4U53_003631 [Claviceps sorghi]